jgi:hypothetical protein
MTKEELKQRLIEIIQTATVEMKYCTSDGIPIVTTEKHIVDEGEVLPLVDHLIANGVTIRERGEWQWDERFSDYTCSNCNNWDLKTPNYCSNCGADMRGVTDTNVGDKPAWLFASLDEIIDCYSRPPERSDAE